ncbi:MAG: hypothetical protein AAF658_07945, partial [Myxococcota bacterium]
GSGLDVEREARAYLHSNCSMCHRPNGGTNAELVLTYDTPLADMQICNVEPTDDWPELDTPQIVAPGDASRSLMRFRMNSTVPGERMPQIGTALVDPVGVAVVEAWINSLSECP